MKSRQNRPMPFQNGDRLTQPEFHRLYEQMPGAGFAELIAGVVHVKERSTSDHGIACAAIGAVSVFYKAETPGVEVARRVTTIIDDRNEFQPDITLRLDADCGGQSSVNEDEFYVGGPELAVEVVDGPEAIELGIKKLEYQRAGVCEYLVVCPRSQVIRWFDFVARDELRPDAKGVRKSRRFPGLWLYGPALFEDDGPKLIGTTKAGLATPEHAAFVEELARRRTRK
ncbi:MAG: Uma2 family endonuclease [Gemmataceae bacterium]